MVKLVASMVKKSCQNDQDSHISHRDRHDSHCECLDSQQHSQRIVSRIVKIVHRMVEFAYEGHFIQIYQHSFCINLFDWLVVMKEVTDL